MAVHKITFLEGLSFAGTVIASGNSLIVATDAAGFKQRQNPPMPGQGLQVSLVLI